MYIDTGVFELYVGSDGETTPEEVAVIELIASAPALLEQNKQLYQVLLAWQVLAEESMGFRLALTSLGDNIGVEILKHTQDALALVESETK